MRGLSIIAVSIGLSTLAAADNAFAQTTDPAKLRVQTDLTQTSRVGQQNSTQFFEQFQTSTMNFIETEERNSVFEETDPNEYETTMQMVNLTHLPVDAKLDPDQPHYDLDNGHVLCQPGVDTTVETDECKVEVGAGAVAAILKTDDGVTILDMYDEHQGDVKIFTADGVIRMTPGMQVTLTKHATKPLKEIHPARFIGHRNITEKTASDGTRIFIADYSMFSAVAHMKRIRDLGHSSKKEDRRLFAKIMKTAASITILQGLKGEFSLL